MRVHLMYRDRDFLIPELPSKFRRGDFDVEQKYQPHETALIEDLELNTLFDAMARGDEFLFRVAKHAILSGLENDKETILYRQEVLKDCLGNNSIVKEMNSVVMEALENKKKQWLWLSGNSPGSILFGAVELVQMYLGTLRKLRVLAGKHSANFASEGFATFFAMLTTELADDYLASIKHHLKQLKFRGRILMSAQLGNGNQGTNYVLRRKANAETPWWMDWFSAQMPSAFTFRIAERDQTGAKALSELRDRGINLVANALAQSADHIESFFLMLRTELAFYLGCVNLHDQFYTKEVPLCFPTPMPLGACEHSCTGLRDACLVLSLASSRVIGNRLDADAKDLVIITGANQGGKSTFLRSMGLAQLMMQCGMFVTAESFSAATCRSLFTHYKREEDVTMESGKLDEELRRMSEIVDALTPHSVLLFNESFAATNEREGSEIARQIVRALLERGVKVFFVTHQYEFAHGFFKQKLDGALFLRAEREADAQRTFKILPGEPLQTSFGVDLYKKIFGSKRKGLQEERPLAS